MIGVNRTTSAATAPSTKHRKPRTRLPVKINISRYFIGNKTIAEAFIPVIVDSLQQKQSEIRTFDNDLDMT